MKILTIDIETAPGERYYWDLHEEYGSIEMIIKPPRLLCFAAKWHDKPAVEFLSEWDDGHEPMVERAGWLLNEADAVVHYYGKRFDIPHIRTELLAASLPWPSPHKDIDLKDTVRSKLKLPSSKLDYVSQHFGLGRKVEHEGFKLWRKIVDPTVDEKERRAAQRRMRRYNIGDVRLEEKVYDLLRPIIDGHPHFGLYLGGVRCQNCGSEDLRPDGFAYTNLGKYRRYQCKSCGRYGRFKKAIETADARAAV